MWQEIVNFYQAHKETIDNLLSGSGVLVITSFVGLIGWLIKGVYSRWERKQNRPPTVDTSPFVIIRPTTPDDSERQIIKLAYSSQEKEEKDPLADINIPYQQRSAKHDLTAELETRLKESRWLLITGRTGLGKTREAVKLAQLLNQEGWTVLWLKNWEWLDEPTSQQFTEVSRKRKILFLLDDLNNRMRFGADNKNPVAEKYTLAPINIPLQERLLKLLSAYEKYFGEAEIRVLATTRSELEEWEKLQWEKYPQLWQRFELFSLEEPEDSSIVNLLSAQKVSEEITQINQGNYGEIARQNDGSFRNVVENLRRMRNRKLPLDSEHYIPTLQGTWEDRYQKVVKQYPLTVHLYDAVDVLRQCDIELIPLMVIETAILMEGAKRWRRWRISREMKKILPKIDSIEGILKPRDGQIEAKNRSIEVDKYLHALTGLILQLVERYKDVRLFSSLANFAYKLFDWGHYQNALICYQRLTNNFPTYEIYWFYQGTSQVYLERYEQALASYDRAIEIKPDDYQAWYNKGAALGNLGRNEQALASFDRAIEIKPDDYEAWCNKGVALGNLERYEQALASFDRAIEIKPDNSNAYYNKACCYASQNKLQLAVENLQQAIYIDNKYREMAKTDKDFDPIRSESQFQDLLN